LSILGGRIASISGISKDLEFLGGGVSDRYRVEETAFESESAVLLSDVETGTEACILPGIGANCIAFRARRDGNSFPLLFEPPDPGVLRNRPSGFGIPILFPFPNRVEEGRFTYGNRSFEISKPQGQPHAIHGFVMGRPWQQAAIRARDDIGAMLRCEFRSADYPELESQYPSTFEAASIFRLRDGVLWVTLEGVNTGNEPMPAGIGFHPYFPLPMLESGDREVCTVHLPARSIWPLRDDCIPTGSLSSVAGDNDLRNPRKLGDLTYDDVWSQVTYHEGWSRSTYRDPEAGVSVYVDADESFRELVLYAPDTRPVVCIEPYTCTTNALNLDASGTDAGLVHLAPGEKIRGVMRITAMLEQT